MTDLDHEMLARAKSRDDVTVMIDGRPVAAQLVAWWPHRPDGRRRRNRARVQFRSGRTLTVHTDQVGPPATSASEVAS